MSAAPKRDLVSIAEFSIGEIENLLRVAEDFSKQPQKASQLCKGLILASLFYEPSTRTRLSFESAMLRLGGQVISVPGAGYSSVAKGESLSDTVKVISGYADILVLRHYQEGSARVAAEAASIPLINGGDGQGEHPTQTLCDLFVLRKTKNLNGLTLAACGDLKYSRTVHSLVRALARFKARILLVPAMQLQLPAELIEWLVQEHGYQKNEVEVGEFEGAGCGTKFLFLSPSRSERPAKIDAIYVTRAQTERYEKDSNPHSYFQLNPKMLQAGLFRDTLILHPLPRREELPTALDDDARSVYFAQSAGGVPIRMALIGALLGKISI